MQPVRKVVKASAGQDPSASSVAADVPQATSIVSTGTTSIGGGAMTAPPLLADEDILERLAAKQRKDNSSTYDAATSHEGPSPFTADFLSFRKEVSSPKEKAEGPPTKKPRLEGSTGAKKTPPPRLGGGGRKSGGRGGGGGGNSKSFAPLTGMGDSDSDDSALAFVLGDHKEGEEVSDRGEDLSEPDDDSVLSPNNAAPIGVVLDVEDSDEDLDNAADDGDADRQVGEKSARPGSDQQQPTVIPRQKFKSTVFERFHSYGHGVHSLVSLTEPLTLVGPCLILCVVQDALADGHSLRAAPLVLPDYHHRVSVMPTKRRGRRPDLAGLGTGTQAVEDLLNQDKTIEEAMLGGDKGMKVVEDAKFGNIDWHWVHGKVQSWKQRLGTVPATLLVLEPTSCYERRDAEAEAQGRVSNTTGVVSINTDVPPRCFAKFKGELMEPSLLSNTLPSITSKQDTSIAVLGCSNIGKSTQLRFLCNYLLSSNNASSVLWADFDLGQPEFALPGSLSLHKVSTFLFSRACMTQNGGFHHAVGAGVSVRPEDEAEHLVSFPLGTSSKIRCPVVASRAIAAMCDEILKIRAQPENSRVPLLINTHGWVMRTGRRATLEVLRRLEPRHVIHMLQPSEEPWCTPSLIGDVKAGLNECTVTRRFTVSVAATMAAPSSGLANDAAEQEQPRASFIKSSKSDDLVAIHPVTVNRALPKKRAAAIREVTWLAHLGLDLSGSVLDSSSTSASQVVEVDASKLCLAVTDGGLDGVMDLAPPTVEPARTTGKGKKAASKKETAQAEVAATVGATPPAVARLRNQLLQHAVVVLASSPAAASGTVVPLESFAPADLPRHLGCGIVLSEKQQPSGDSKMKILIGGRPKSKVDLSQCNVLMVNPEEKRPLFSKKSEVQ